ncbi:ATP-binding cassette multidrug transport protein [Hortaea werneckii]|nr:ATP-binding cassette multidrug transport protein [Hortaea werneckii]KAI7594146.1 ATP-binding cassette multidrug transport protein [Hortaea werneckii]
MITFTRAATAATELFTLIDRVSDIDPLDPAGKKPASFDRSIDISGLDFSYPTRRDVTVLEDFSLRILTGKVTALVGASESDKSTTIGLLERWYNPSRGDITLDGTSIKMSRRYPWEHESPEDQLLRDKDAAKTAFVHEFIETPPLQQYYTRIGERGGLLSDGKKQRVAIARSIISQPKALLLDEATSALDPRTEAIVQKALDKASKDRTTIVIAHKLKTIQAADNIVVMAKGKIIEQGRHAELIARGTAYANPVRAQDLLLRKEISGAEPTHEHHDESVLENSVSLGRHDASARELLNLLSKREVSGLFSSTGIMSNAVRLVQSTPDLKWWYILSIISSALGAGVYPGQALLLGKVMDVFTPELDQRRGNYFALMVFIMAVCLLFVYMAMGWISNHIPQVRVQSLNARLTEM